MEIIHEFHKIKSKINNIKQAAFVLLFKDSLVFRTVI